jgi:hypothetical protein
VDGHRNMLSLGVMFYEVLTGQAPEESVALFSKRRSLHGSTTTRLGIMSCYEGRSDRLSRLLNC